MAGGSPKQNDNDDDNVSSRLEDMAVLVAVLSTFLLILVIGCRLRSYMDELAHDEPSARRNDRMREVTSLVMCGNMSRGKDDDVARAHIS